MTIWDAVNDISKTGGALPVDRAQPDSPGPGKLVGVTGFEPATSSSRTTRATKLRYTPDVDAMCRVGIKSVSPSFQNLFSRSAMDSPCLGEAFRTGALKGEGMGQVLPTVLS